MSNSLTSALFSFRRTNSFEAMFLPSFSPLSSKERERERERERRTTALGSDHENEEIFATHAVRHRFGAQEEKTGRETDDIEKGSECGLLRERREGRVKELLEVIECRPILNGQSEKEADVLKNRTAAKPPRVPATAAAPAPALNAHRN